MRHSLTTNSLYNVLYRIVAVLYPLVAVTYVSHILQSDRMGAVAYAQNIVSYFVVLAALGLPTYGIREIARTSQSVEARSRTFFELFLLNAISTTVAFAMYFVVVLLTPHFSNNLHLYLVAGLQIMLNYLGVDWFFQGMEEYRYISIRSSVVKLLAIVALFLFVKKPEDYINYALIYCLALAGNNVPNALRIGRYARLPSSKLCIQRHIRPVLVLLAVSVAVEVYSMIDTTMLGML